MSQHERTGKRCMAFSRWRRKNGASLLDERHTAIDVDWCEYCAIHNVPLALIECVRSWNKCQLIDTAKQKPASITLRLAKMANIKSFVVAYVPISDDDIEFAVVRNLSTGEISGVLNSAGLSRFIDSIHRSCGLCNDIKKNCGDDFTYWDLEI